MEREEEVNVLRLLGSIQWSMDVAGDGAEFLERLDEVEDDRSGGAMNS
jgi:hypothetical protein